MRFIGAGSRPGQPHVDRDLVFTVPNFLTVLRFMGVPLFIWLVLAQREYGFAVLVLAIMGSTDWVDGYIARRFNQASKLGRILDPIADRLALIAVAVTLVIAGVVDWWYLAALVIPDAVLLSMSLFYFHSHPDLPVSLIGKTRTGLLLLGVPGSLRHGLCSASDWWGTGWPPTNTSGPSAAKAECWLTTAVAADGVAGGIPGCTGSVFPCLRCAAPG
ncbi:MAG: CDP-diacylglycerol--glycerol-3-phosphate 3-phosphatidyltransferase [Arthrobacter sp.]|nr:CDP-diacylglycerol--glycerol-3-phosphate 3-phosphatidyltransferase [Arthrobacter sp.]